MVKGRVGGRGGRGLLDEGEAGGTVAFNGIGLAFGEEGLALALVTGRLANGDGRGERQSAQKGLQVGGVLASGIDADVEVYGANALLQTLELVQQLVITLTGFGNFAGWTGGLEILAQEGNVMTIAGGVKADADGDGRSSGQRGRHGVVLATRILRQVRDGSRESPPSMLRRRSSL
jgi:hypothetical protein